MAKGLYYYLRQAWKRPDKDSQKQRLIQWRKEPVQVKVDKPTNIARARSLGYKEKKGFTIVRVRLKRGGHKRPRPNKGRRSKRLHNRRNLKMSYSWIAEQRVQNKHRNLEVLNSYKVGSDGKQYFFEVICVDPQKNEIKSDKELNWITSNKHTKRVNRGLTSAAKKSRGLKYKNPENKNRPSVRAGKRRGK